MVMFQMGLPMGMRPPVARPAGISYREQPTTVSVGPYSFSRRTPGACRCQKSVGSASRLSAPMTRVPVLAAASPGDSSPFSRARWVGVILIMLKPGVRRMASASASTPGPSGSSSTRSPQKSGMKFASVRSTAMEEKTGAPRPWAARYASRPQAK